jgi:hypothetical protein
MQPETIVASADATKTILMSTNHSKRGANQGRASCRVENAHLLRERELAA